jgi:hypothetical protein
MKLQNLIKDFCRSILHVNFSNKYIIFCFSENSVGSESLIKGEGGNESKKSEKVTTKSVIFSFQNSFNLNYFLSCKTRNFTTFEKALSNEWKPNRRQATTRSAITTYNLLRSNYLVLNS